MCGECDGETVVQQAARDEDGGRGSVMARRKSSSRREVLGAAVGRATRMGISGTESRRRSNRVRNEDGGYSARRLEIDITQAPLDCKTETSPYPPDAAFSAPTARLKDSIDRMRGRHDQEAHQWM